jgi:hypothetical protein
MMLSTLWTGSSNCSQKKHSVFKDFAHQLSEAIFVRAQDDEDSVQAVIEKKGRKWSYMLCAHSAALHKRIR